MTTNSPLSPLRQDDPAGTLRSTVNERTLSRLRSFTEQLESPLGYAGIVPPYRRAIADVNRRYGPVLQRLADDEHPVACGAATEPPREPEGTPE